MRQECCSGLVEWSLKRTGLNQARALDSAIGSESIISYSKFFWSEGDLPRPGEMNSNVGSSDISESESMNKFFSSSSTSGSTHSTPSSLSDWCASGAQNKICEVIMFQSRKRELGGIWWFRGGT